MWLGVTHEVAVFCLREGTEPILSRQAKRALLLVPSVPWEHVPEVPIEGLRVTGFGQLNDQLGRVRQEHVGLRVTEDPPTAAKQGAWRGVLLVWGLWLSHVRAPFSAIRPLPPGLKVAAAASAVNSSFR